MWECCWFWIKLIFNWKWILRKVLEMVGCRGSDLWFKDIKNFDLGVNILYVFVIIIFFCIWVIYNKIEMI